MNAEPQFSKPCYRCPAVVRMTREQYAADENETTICAICRAKLDVEAEAALTPLLVPEALTPLLAAASPGFVPGPAPLANNSKDVSTD